MQENAKLIDPNQISRFYSIDNILINAYILKYDTQQRILKMFPLFFSLVLSVLFGTAAYSTYGLEGFMESCWIDVVLSSLILTGFAVSLVGEMNDCLACKLKTRFSNSQWLETICFHSSCKRSRLNTMIHQ